MHDVIIVGAGPAGSLAARSLAEQKFEVQVLEEHPSPGLPQHCTGLLTDEVINMSGVKPDIYNTIQAGEFIFPNGQSITLRPKKPMVRVVDRVDMEVKMADAAINAGADYSFSEKYTSHNVGDAVLVDSETRTHRGKVLIGADGASSAIAMSLGENRPKEYVRGIQADVRYTMDEQDCLKIFLGSNVAPGFFAWMIPCGPFTRIGLCTSWSANPPSEYLSDILLRMGMKDKVMKLYSGKIPLGIRPSIYGDRVILTGDAAGFVKPLSGGGLYPTFKANKHIVEAISSGLDTDALYSRDLSEYGRKCHEDFGRELERSYFLRKRFKRLSDTDMNKVYDYIKKNDLEPILNEIDLDHPSELVNKISRIPKAVISVLPLFLRTIR